MIDGGHLHKRKFGAVTVLISTFTKFDKYSVCIAIILIEYEITNNVH